MTGPEHYREAEQLVDEAVSWDSGEQQYRADATVLAAAQVHATLALAAATADRIVEKWTGGEGGAPIQRHWTEATS